MDVSVVFAMIRKGQRSPEKNGSLNDQRYYKSNDHNECDEEKDDLLDADATSLTSRGLR